jgi:hypothetical protein
MKRICVIGAGTGGVVSVLSLINRLKDQCKVTCMYDPSIPTIQVGESTSSAILELLKSSIGFRILRDLPEVDGTLKYGSKYFNWSSTDFFVYGEDPALHLNSAKFSFWVLDKVKELYPTIYNEIHTKVESIEIKKYTTVINNEHEFDFVFDCRGFPNAEELKTGYLKPKFESVNSAIIFPEFTKYDEMYSSSYGTRNGWMFGIPLTHRKAWGYLYNNNFTSKEEAIEDFKQIKNLTDEDIAKTRSLSWTSFYKEKAMEGSLIYSGNKLLFFEPGQGLALHYYMVLADYLAHLIQKRFDLETIINKINYFHTEVASDFQDLIAMNYNGTPIYDSAFWRYAKQSTTDRLANSRHWRDWASNPSDYKQFSIHANEVMLDMVKGFQVDLTQYKNDN